MKHVRPCKLKIKLIQMSWGMQVNSSWFVTVGEDECFRSFQDIGNEIKVSLLSVKVQHYANK